MFVVAQTTAMNPRMVATLLRCEPAATSDPTSEMPEIAFVADMTTWQASLSREGVPDLRYRTRFIARFVDDWRSLQLRSEARWARGDEADVGYDSAQLDSLATDLRGKLGKK